MSLGDRQGRRKVMTSWRPQPPLARQTEVERAQPAMVSEALALCDAASRLDAVRIRPVWPARCLGPALSSSPTQTPHLQSPPSPEQGPGYQQDGVQLSQSRPALEVPLPGSQEGEWGGGQRYT